MTCKKREGTFAMRIQTGVSIIMNRWLEVSRDELVLFITDETHLREAEAVEEWARASDSVLKVVVLPADAVQSGDVIHEMEEQLCRANVIIGATDYSFITTPEVSKATKAGARFLSLPLSCSNGTSLLENEFIAMDCRWTARMAKKILPKINKAERLHVETALGTDLTFYKKGRKGGYYNGSATRRGDVASASFEVYVAPVEDATEGILVLDGSLGYEGLVNEPIHIEFHNGRLSTSDTHEDARRLVKYIESFGSDTMWVNGEFGIGLNALSRCRGVSYIEDESTYGTFHIGMGRNISLGGVQSAPGHFDIVTHDPTIWADGVCIMRDGEIVE